MDLDAAQSILEKLEATQAVIGTDGSAVTTLQSDVANLKTESSSLSTQVQASQVETKKLENPDTIRYKGIELKPGGFLAAETVDRQRGIGGDVNTQFSGIPFAGSTAGELSEFNASGRQKSVAQ